MIRCGVTNLSERSSRMHLKLTPLKRIKIILKISENWCFRQQLWRRTCKRTLRSWCVRCKLKREMNAIITVMNIWTSVVREKMMNTLTCLRVCQLLKPVIISCLRNLSLLMCPLKRSLKSHRPKLLPLKHVRLNQMVEMKMRIVKKRNLMSRILRIQLG